MELNESDDNQEELDILQLKENVLTRGFVALEEIFQFIDVSKKPKIEHVSNGIEECNIGTQ